jgi:hypothetical protein
MHSMSTCERRLRIRCAFLGRDMRIEDGPEDIVLAYIGIKWLDGLEDAGVSVEAVVEGLFRAH